MSKCTHPGHNHSKCFSGDEVESISTSLLKNNKLSITIPRKLILNLLIKEHGPFSVEEILSKLPENTCDQATVYRCLKQFVEAGLVSTTNFNQEFTLYEYNDPSHHHHHIVCKICHNIESFDECLIDPILNKLKSKGYADISHKFEIFAICNDCQNK